MITRKANAHTCNIVMLEIEGLDRRMENNNMGSHCEMGMLTNLIKGVSQDRAE